MRGTVIAIVVAAGALTTAVAQSPPANEKALREAMAAAERGPANLFAPDWVFWSGAYVKPLVANEQPQFRPGSSASNRDNQKQAVTVIQLKIAESGDMAYEYSTVKSSWDRNDNKRHIETEGGMLRVWRNIGGKWLIVASFQHPYDNTPTER
jgi:ketosteroid isomerase-like protein